MKRYVMWLRDVVLPYRNLGKYCRFLAEIVVSDICVYLRLSDCMRESYIC